MTDLWTEATHDAEADAMARKVTAARVSAVDLWPFLAGAENEADYANRKAIVADRLDQIVSAMHPNDPVGFGVVRSSLEASLDEDYRVIAEARAEEEQTRQRVAARVEEQQARARIEANLQRQAGLSDLDDAGLDKELRRVMEQQNNTRDKGMQESLRDFRKQLEDEQKKRKGGGSSGGGPGRDQDGKFAAKTASTSPDVLQQIQRNDPDGGSTPPTDLDYANFKAWVVSTFGQEAWDDYHGTWPNPYSEGDQGWREGAKTAASDTGTCAECGRGISYDKDSRKWSHDNEGPDTAHPAKKAAKTATRYCTEHKVYVGEGNQENHDHCNVETRKKKDAAKTAGLQVKKFQGGPGGMWGLWDTEADTWHEGDYDDAKYAAGVPYWESEDKAQKHTGSKTAAFPPGQDATQPAAEQTSAQVVERRVDQDPETGEFVGSEWVEKEGDPGTLVQSDATFGKNPRFKSQEEGDAWVAEAGGEEAPEEEPAEVEDTTKTDPAKSKVPEQFEKKTKASKTAVKVGDYVKDSSGRKGVVEDFTDDKVQVHWDNTNGYEWVSPDSLSKESAKTADRSPEEVAELRAEQARLKAEWDEAFAALRAAGLEADADDPIAKRYRDASDAVNHVNRKLDYHVIKGSAKTAETHAPYKIEERDGKFVVVNDIGETKGTHDTKEEAREQQKALYANVEGASEQAEKKSSSRTAAEDIDQQMYEWGYAKGQEARNGDPDPNLDQDEWSNADGSPIDWKSSDKPFPRGYRDGLEGKPKQASRGRHPFAERTARSQGADQITSPGQVKVGDKVWFSRGHMRSAVDGTVANVTDDAVEVVGSQSKGRIRMTFADLADGEWKLHPRTAANPYSVSGNPYVAPMQAPGTPDDVLDGPADPNPPVLDMPMTTRPRQRPNQGQQAIDADAPVEMSNDSAAIPQTAQARRNAVRTTPIICHADGTRFAVATVTPDLTCTSCGSGDHLDLDETLEAQASFETDPEMGQVKETDAVKQHVTCSTCFTDATVTATDPAQPMPPCPNCGAPTLSPAGSTLATRKTAGWSIVSPDGTPLWGMVYDSEQGAQAHYDSIKGRNDAMVPPNLSEFEVKEVSAPANRTYDSSSPQNPFQPLGSQGAASRREAKIAEVIKGIRATNPGMDPLVARRIATETVQRYPQIVGN